MAGVVRTCNGCGNQQYIQEPEATASTAVASDDIQPIMIVLVRRGVIEDEL